eukprot:gb/GECH01004077.1/.p1 GENE.gb/GECH01004077.1/~~gb/GECH01004077.1/.p1  ORF type:complete len:327 (+),score=86.92 gb/GECH01004077.1/:1-981(+)
MLQRDCQVYSTPREQQTPWGVQAELLNAMQEQMILQRETPIYGMSAGINHKEGNHSPRIGYERETASIKNKHEKMKDLDQQIFHLTKQLGSFDDTTTQPNQDHPSQNYEPKYSNMLDSERFQNNYVYPVYSVANSSSNLGNFSQAAHSSQLPSSPPPAIPQPGVHLVTRHPPPETDPRHARRSPPSISPSSIELSRHGMMNMNSSRNDSQDQQRSSHQYSYAPSNPSSMHVEPSGYSSNPRYRLDHSAEPNQYQNFDDPHLGYNITPTQRTKNRGRKEKSRNGNYTRKKEDTLYRPSTGVTEEEEGEETERERETETEDEIENENE